MNATAGSAGISFGVQTRVGVGELAQSGRRIEAAGFDRVVVADHPGLTGDPFTALAILATVTESIGLGTYVVNAGLREPWQIATAAATLQVACGGRFELGLGAGHTPAEWDLVGRPQGTPGSRIDRLGESITLIKALLDGGAVDFHGEWFTCHGAQLADAPIEMPILLGGNGRRLLALAAQHAQVVAMTGFGATQPDGHSHAVRWSRRAFSQTMSGLSDAERAHGTRPEREVLVQRDDVLPDGVEILRALH